MAKAASEYTDTGALRRLMANAKRLNRDDIWREAFLRLCALEGGNQDDPLHRDFYATLAAYGAHVIPFVNDPLMARG